MKLSEKERAFVLAVRQEQNRLQSQLAAFIQGVIYGHDLPDGAYDLSPDCGELVRRETPPEGI